ncbi:MAG: hypothetical protein AVDCRST_MAG22-3669 [uncultured Rubrobacteraceae bacterium]|uniref:DUF7452 domain-containing protein n=1 Tax=uncultured Rubrobacteraceae bacterium TaxID=349277 RepID=A0A6J4QBI7_9ACTN|nr:MAG: hypothetical protein AVDCRST_MAG22-3669 [uncultured Rubrobacteraceae bacterium]
MSTGGATYGHNIGVWFEPRTQRWAIFNQDRAAVPAGSIFEVFIPQRSERFVHRSEPANTGADSTYLDDPITRGDPEILLTVTQNWNPGGGGGIYNDHPIGVRYDEGVGKWIIYNRDGAPMPTRAAFNVAVSDGGESAG